jgi:glycosyltransferase involved in cell wall biosynthesis
MFNAVQASPHLVVTICCREREWREVQSYYGPLDTARVRIVHQQGDELAAHYARADLFVLIRNPDPYLDFAMPVKVFESLGYGLPIVAIEGTGAARFVAQEDIGWVATTEAELVRLLGYLHAHPELIGEKRRHVEMVRERHTWLARAQTVAAIMTSIAKRTDKE